MWNKIEDRKPENGQQCVVRDDEGFYYFATYCPETKGSFQHGDWKFQTCPCCGDITEITHWMPLEKVT